MILWFFHNVQKGLDGQTEMEKEKLKTFDSNQKILPLNGRVSLANGCRSYSLPFHCYDFRS